MQQIIVDINQLHFDRPYRAYAFVQLQFQTQQRDFVSRPVEGEVAAFKGTFKVNMPQQITLFPLEKRVSQYLVRILDKRRNLIFYLWQDVSFKSQTYFQAILSLDAQFSISFQGQLGQEMLSPYKAYALQYIDRPQLSANLFERYLVEIETDTGAFTCSIEETTRVCALASENGPAVLSVFGLTIGGLKYLLFSTQIEACASHLYYHAQQTVLTAENTAVVAGFNAVVQNAKPELLTARDVDENYLVNLVLSQDAVLYSSGYNAPGRYASPAARSHPQHVEFQKAVKLFRKAGGYQTEVKLTQSVRMVLYYQSFVEAVGPDESQTVMDKAGASGMFCLAAKTKEFMIKVEADQCTFYVAPLVNSELPKLVSQVFAVYALNNVSTLYEVKQLRISVLDGQFYVVREIHSALINNALAHSNEIKSPVAVTADGIEFAVFGCDRFKTIDEQMNYEIPQDVIYLGEEQEQYEYPAGYPKSAAAPQNSRQPAEPTRETPLAGTRPQAFVQPLADYYVGVATVTVYQKLEYERNRLRIIDLKREGQRLEAYLYEKQRPSRLLSDYFLLGSQHRQRPIQEADLRYFNANLNLQIPAIIDSHEKLAIFFSENLSQTHIACGVLDCCKASLAISRAGADYAYINALKEIEGLQATLRTHAEELATMRAYGLRLTDEERQAIYQAVNGAFY